MKCGSIYGSPHQVQYVVTQILIDTIYWLQRRRTNAMASRIIAINGSFYYHGLTLIPAWISNYIHFNVWDEITYQFLNFNGCTVEV